MPGVNQPPGGYAPGQYGTYNQGYQGYPQQGYPQQGPDYAAYAQQAAQYGQAGVNKLNQLPAPTNPGRFFVVVLVIQVISCLLTILVLKEVFTGFLFALCIIAGFFAYRTGFYGTYILGYALGCFALGIWTFISALLPMIIDFVSLDWMKVLLYCFLPITMWIGTWASWHLYKANMVQLPQQGALFGTGQQMGAPGYAPQGGFQPAYPGY